MDSLCSLNLCWRNNTSKYKSILADNYDIDAQQAGIHYMPVSRAYTLVCIILIMYGNIHVKRFQPAFSNFMFFIPFQYHFFYSQL